MIWNPEVTQTKGYQITYNTEFTGPQGVDMALGHDGTGCYIDIAYKDAWTATTSGGSQIDPGMLPHGVYVKLVSGAQSISVSDITGNWFSAFPAAQLRTNATPPTTVIYWNKQPTTTYPPVGHAIPSGQQLSFRIHFAGLTGATISIELRELTGASWPDQPDAIGAWTGKDPHDFSKPSKTYVLTLVGCPPVSGNCFQLAKHTWGTLQVLTTNGANPPVGSVVKLYKRPAAGTCGCDPFILGNANSWDPDGKAEATATNSVQHPEVFFPTNRLDNPFCFAAVIDEGCYSYATPPATVNVCPVTSLIGPLTADPGTPPLNAQNHACMSWQGTSISFPDPGVCYYSVKWSKSTNGGVSWTSIGSTTNQHALSISGSVGSLTFLGTGCSTTYEFKADISYVFCNVTQQASRVLTIVIDKTTDPGKVTANPWKMCMVQPPCPACPVSPYDEQHPVLCYYRATTLTCTPVCGSVVRWDSLNGGTSGTWCPMTWVHAAQAFNTHKLKQTQMYRAAVSNGACPEKYVVTTVVVKPQLWAKVTGNTVVCENGGSTTLTASTAYDNVPVPPGFCKTIQWRYYGGNIVGAMGKTYDAKHAGNYDVYVSDPVCGDTWSNVLTVCSPGISISGLATVCRPGPNLPSCSFTLTASDNGCASCGTYTWTKPDGTHATGPSVTDQLPANVPHGTYTVTNTCGGCAVSASFTVKVCP